MTFFYNPLAGRDSQNSNQVEQAVFVRHVSVTHVKKDFIKKVHFVSTKGMTNWIWSERTLWYSRSRWIVPLENCLQLTFLYLPHYCLWCRTVTYLKGYQTKHSWPVFCLGELKTCIPYCLNCSLSIVIDIMLNYKCRHLLIIRTISLFYMDRSNLFLLTWV